MSRGLVLLRGLLQLSSCLLSSALILREHLLSADTEDEMVSVVL
jgi:hypothetical protein